jgi:hypothetical protein
MKRLLFFIVIILFALACKKTEFEPEGPTDVRIKNLSTLTFEEVIVTASENAEDVDTITKIDPQSVSEYMRFTKAYTEAGISATINVGGTMETFSTGPVVFTYLTYVGQVRMTFEVYISSMENRELKISNRILEEALVLE